MLQVIKSLFKKPTQKQPFLKPEDVIQLAQNATKGMPGSESLCHTTLQWQDNHAFWIVTTAVKGSGIEVVISDESGDIISVRKMGIR